MISHLIVAQDDKAFVQLNLGVEDSVAPRRTGTPATPLAGGRFSGLAGARPSIVLGSPRGPSILGSFTGFPQTGPPAFLFCPAVRHRSSSGTAALIVCGLGIFPPTERRLARRLGNKSRY